MYYHFVVYLHVYSTLYGKVMSDSSRSKPFQQYNGFCIVNVRTIIIKCVSKERKSEGIQFGSKPSSHSRDQFS